MVSHEFDALAVAPLCLIHFYLACHNVGPTIVMVHIVCLSVCLSHANISKTKRDRHIVQALRFCHQIRDQKYGSAILGVSGLALCPFRQKWAGWDSECSEWISGNSHQSASHWALWRASYHHVPWRTIPCFYNLWYFVDITSIFSVTVLW